MIFFQNINIRTKLFSGIFLVILIFLALIFWQFSSLEKINSNTEILKRTENSIYAIKQLSEINLGEMQRLLEIIQTEETETIESIYESHTFSKKQLLSIYDSIFQDIKVIFPDNSGMERIKVVNYLNETQEKIHNVLNPYFENVNSIKRDQLDKGDRFLPDQLFDIPEPEDYERDTTVADSTKEIVQVEMEEITGSTRSVQLQKIFRYYKQNHDKVNEQYSEINQVLRIGFSTSTSQIDYLNSRIKVYNSLFFLIALGSAFIILLLVSNTISRPLRELEKMVAKLAEGELPEHSDVTTKDEIGTMASALNALTDGLIKTSAFASEIGRGNFISEFEPLSKKDVLGNSLLEMRKSLQAANEEENKRKIEDQERNWTTEGLARFGEILRRHTENIGLLSKDIVQNLVKYLNANQGGIFILNDSDQENVYLDLMAAYAYNREKFINKRIQLGQGLVGGAAVEKYTVHMTDLPEDYIEIESGIGGSNPHSLLIVPLKLEDIVLGVIEIASFNEFKSYEIELVERIGESIASTLSTAKINTQTAELLEQSRIQTQEMQEQDEEMRQNMEEMIAAQEESLRREEELRKEVNELESIRATLTDKDKNQRTRIEKLSKESASANEELERLIVQINRSFNSNLDALLMINESRKVQFFNSAAENLFEYNKSEVLGLGINTLMSEETAKALEESIILYFQTGRKGLIDMHREISILNKNGDTIPVVLTMLDTVIKGNRRIAIFIKNLGKIRALEIERDIIKQNLMSKEFDYTTKINTLESFIQENGLQIPLDLEAQSDLISWNENYSINLNIIDQQHKRWIDFINILYKSYKTNAKKKEVSENISKLLDYTDYHFGFEEKYLEDFNCGNVENHKKDHSEFINTIKEHHLLYDGGENEAVYRLIIYLNNWVLDHIQGDDKRYVECFKLNGLS